MVRELSRLHAICEGDFLNGSELDPEPPGSGKDPDARWVDIYEGEFDEEQMEEWVRQSAAIPGWKGF